MIEGVDLVCRLEGADGAAAAPRGAGDAGRRAASGRWSSAAARRCASGPATRSATCAAAAGRSRASSGAGGDGRGRARSRSETYPDPLARVWSALTAPHSGDFVVSLAPGFEAVDWGGVSHAGGGSHGALHAGDSLGPLLFVGCGPESADEREQWTLRDVAPVVREHFGAALRRAAPLRSLPRSSWRCSPRPALAARAGEDHAGRSDRRRRPRPEGPRPGARRTASWRRRATLDDGNWEVAYFADGDEVALVLVDPTSGEVSESWTGYQVAWKMARGYSGAFGHKLNAPYVFLPLCLIFLLGLVDWRRLRRVANLDLLVLLGFGVSHFFFNRAKIGVSVPLVYPVLLYLLGRCAVDRAPRAGGRGCGRSGRSTWLLVAALFLMGFRVGLNVADSGAIDVGYAGVVGADRIAHGEPIYDNFPDDVSQGDTYGPVNYFAYVPFELIWPWSGEWDDLPAAHAAAILFDLAVFAFLILLGIRIRPGPAGRRLAAILAFGWAAYPYTAYALESNSNDSLVAALLRRDAAAARHDRLARGAAAWRSRPGPSSSPRCWPRCCLTYDPRAAELRPALLVRSPASPLGRPSRRCSGRRSTRA